MRSSVPVYSYVQILPCVGDAPGACVSIVLYDFLGLLYATPIH